MVVLNGWPFGDSAAGIASWINYMVSLIADLRQSNPTCQIICFGSCLEAGAAGDVLITESTSIFGISEYGKYKGCS